MCILPVKAALETMPGEQYETVFNDLNSSDDDNDKFHIDISGEY